MMKKMETLIKQQRDNQRRSLPLQAKIKMTEHRIKDWFNYWDGDVYLSFSGGKDSDVLRDIIMKMRKPYCDIPIVFCNTGLEYPEVLKHVRELAKEHNQIEQIRPERTFKDIWENDGIPLVSKRVARMIRIARGELGGEQSRNLILNGINKHGKKTNSRWKMPEKWKPLINTNIKISDTCCDYLKKKPFIKYEKETGRKVMTAMMSGEGGTRDMIQQCNMFEGSRPKSSPMLFWLEDDVWAYINSTGMGIAETYYDKKYEFKGQKVLIEGEKRTGCMFCAFGQHMEKGCTKFQKMQVTHPRQHEKIIYKMKLNEALDEIGVKYEYELPDDENC
jgi:3'-phosphoadenosine 5'-phosphosulfate sulfotransferase (PAPS reductase)/FAD synthetase